MYNFPLFRGKLPPAIISSLWHSRFSAKVNPFHLCAKGDQEACEYLSIFGGSREEQAKRYYCWAQTVPPEICEGVFWRLPLTRFAKYIANMVPPLAMANLMSALGLDAVFKTETLVDCCAGVGGWLIAICHYRRCSVRRVYAIDVDRDVLSLYVKVGKALGVEVVPVAKDVRTLGEFPKADAIVGSPPCQEFSNAKTSAPRDVRLGFSVVEAYLRLATKVEVPAIMEEVYYRGMHTLASAYGFRSKVVALRDFGAIQRQRERFVAWRTR